MPLAWALIMELWQNSVFVTQLNTQTLLARTRKSILDVEQSIAWRVSFMHDVSLLSMFHVLEKGAVLEFRQIVCKMQGNVKGLPWRTLNRNYCSDNGLVVVKPYKSYRWTPSFRSNTLSASSSRSYNPQHHNMSTHLSQNFASYINQYFSYYITVQVLSELGTHRKQ